jgi:hypothetical protein
MPPYERTSVEELRWAHLMANADEHGAVEPTSTENDTCHSFLIWRNKVGIPNKKKKHTFDLRRRQKQELYSCALECVFAGIVAVCIRAP